MNMKIYCLKLSVVVISFFFVSCEYHHNSRIINESGDEIDLIVVFNKKVFKKAWGKDSYIPYLSDYNNEPPGIVLVSFDSINLKSSYKIRNKGFFSISHGMGGKIINPTYEEFISLTVLTKMDTTVVNNHQEFKNKFRPDGKNNFAWVIH